MGDFSIDQQELSGGGSSGTAQVVERCQRLWVNSPKSDAVFFAYEVGILSSRESPGKMNIKNGQILQKGMSPRGLLSFQGSRSCSTSSWLWEVLDPSLFMLFPTCEGAESLQDFSATSWWVFQGQFQGLNDYLHIYLIFTHLMNI